MMKIATETIDGKPVITIAGDLEIAGVAAAKPDLLARLAQEGEILFDHGGVAGCDTAGLQLVLMARAGAIAKGQPFAVIGQSPSFRAAADRAGIPNDCFNHRKAGE